MTHELLRADADKVLPQVETRGRVWNADTLAWEVASTDALLLQILDKLEEIRVLLGGT